MGFSVVVKIAPHKQSHYVNRPQNGDTAYRIPGVRPRICRLTVPGRHNRLLAVHQRTLRLREDDSGRSSRDHWRGVPSGRSSGKDPFVPSVSVYPATKLR